MTMDVSVCCQADLVSKMCDQCKTEHEWCSACQSDVVNA